MSVTRLTAAPLKLLTDPRCGRYIVAARDIGRGETVLAARPYAVAITSRGVCGLCLAETDVAAAAGADPSNKNTKHATATPLRKGPSCKRCGLSYCGEECFNRHAEFHVASGQCRVQQLLRESGLQASLDTCNYETVALLATILARANTNGELAAAVQAAAARRAAEADGEEAQAEQRAASDEAKLQALANLDTVLALSRVTPGAAGSPFAPIEPTLQDVLSQVSNVDGMGPRDVKRFQHCFVEYERLRALDARLPEPGTTAPPATRTLPRVSERLWTRLCGIDQCNSFGFWHRHPSVSHFCRATAAAPGAALFNHSCDPNIVRVNSGSSPVFVAMRNIPAGTPVCISYVETAQGLEARSKSLRTTYKFDCECARCMAELDAATAKRRSRDNHDDEEEPTMPRPSSFDEIAEQDAAKQLQDFFSAQYLTCGSCRNGFLLPAKAEVFAALVPHYPQVVTAAKVTKEAKRRWKLMQAAAGTATAGATELRCSCCFGSAALQN